MLLEKGEILQNRYEIVEKIGSGGMAVVYKAVDNKLARKVAIKVLREEFASDEEFITRFINEAQAAAQLSHPNIVNVYDVENYDGIYYIVMELIEGKTLKELIDEKAPFDETSALSVAHQIASALYIAHTHGIIHRDIKPQNIIVVRDGSVKVADFGIAKAATSKTISSKGGAIGSVHYFSPEQAKGGYVDDKSDIYSLGIVMYEMLSGRLPYDGESSVEVALKHINEEMFPLSEIDSVLSESVIAIVEKATQKRRELRYPNVEAMMQDLKKALTDKSGYFVVKKKIDTSQTIKFTDDEIMQIRKESQKNSWDDYGENENGENYEYGQDNGDSVKPKKPNGLSNDIKIIIAAAITALIIIIMISLAASKVLFGPSMKTNSIKMPFLVGMQFDEASVEMERLGLVLKMNEVNDDTVPEGEIISQGVEKDAELFEKDTVYVAVSIGPMLYEIPGVEKLDEAVAYQKFNELELPLNFLDTIYEYSETTAYGIVIKQEPKENEKVPAGTDVQLYVSKGPEIKEVEVPHVVGETEAEAIAILEGLGLAVTRSPASSATYAAGRVISQSRNAGSMVRASAVINIVVSTGPPPPEPPPEEETPEPPKTKTVTYRIDPPLSLLEGAENLRVMVVLTSTETGKSTFPFDEYVDVEDFPLFVPITGSGEADISVYIDNVEQWHEHENFDAE